MWWIWSVCRNLQMKMLKKWLDIDGCGRQTTKIVPKDFHLLVFTGWDNTCSFRDFLLINGMQQFKKISLLWLVYKSKEMCLLSWQKFPSLPSWFPCPEEAIWRAAAQRGPHGKRLRAASSQQPAEDWGPHANNPRGTECYPQSCEWA